MDDNTKTTDLTFSQGGRVPLTQRYGLLVIVVWISFACTVFCTGRAGAQTQASYGQQIAVAKMLRAGLATIGVMTSNLSDKAIEQINRAATAQGVKIVVAKPQDASQISAFYAKLVSEKKAELIWIPDGGDQMLTGVGFEFLRAKALGDKIGLMVPSESMVPSGGLCTVLSEGGKVRVIVNQRIAQIIGISVPSESTAAISYESK
jgi:ABC-type uncharacterized transport system substrate-binding protein